MNEDAMDYIQNYPENQQKAIIKALVVGEALEEFFKTPHGAAVSELFITTIESNIKNIIELSATKQYENKTPIIMDMAREIYWCVNKLREMANFINRKDEVKE